jgi:hypothetical protein
MSRNLLILSALLLLVGFGCAGRGYNAPAHPPSAGQQLQVGDSDIAPQQPPSENDTISNEEVIPPDNSSVAAGANPSANVSAGSGSALPDDSDLLVSNETNEDLISQEDVVGPP